MKCLDGLQYQDQPHGHGHGMGMAVYPLSKIVKTPTIDPEHRKIYRYDIDIHWPLRQ